MQFIMRILALFLPIPVLGRIASERRKADLQHEWNMMSNEQITILGRAYVAGLDHDLAETMRAICWQESSCGYDLENEEDGTEGSYGYFGANPVIVATRVFKTWRKRPTDNQIQVCKNALMGFEYGAEQCVLELQHWLKEYLPGEWSKVWASYNSGYNLRDGKGYARDIKDKIMFLRGVL